MALSLQSVAATAPDQGSFDAARKLLKPGQWPVRGTDGNGLAWGECQGSGSSPYRISLATDDLDAAAGLLSLIQGAPAHSERLAKAAASLQLTTEGLIRRKRMLKPANSATTFAQFQAPYEGLTIESLAEQLDLSAVELYKITQSASEALLLAMPAWRQKAEISTRLSS